MYNDFSKGLINLKHWLIFLILFIRIVTYIHLVLFGQGFIILRLIIFIKEWLEGGLEDFIYCQRFIPWMQILEPLMSHIYRCIQVCMIKDLLLSYITFNQYNDFRVLKPFSEVTLSQNLLLIFRKSLKIGRYLRFFSRFLKFIYFLNVILYVSIYHWSLLYSFLL